MDELEHTGVKIPPPLIFAAFFIAGRVLDYVLNASKLGTAQTETLGVLLIFGALIMFYFATGSFRREKTAIRPNRPSTKLIDYGIYKYSRNPMYLALLTGYLGFALFLGSLWALILAVFAFITINIYAIEKEEKYLKRTFGKKYEEYLKRTRRWL